MKGVWRVECDMCGVSRLVCEVWGVCGGSVCVCMWFPGSGAQLTLPGPMRTAMGGSGG